MNKTQPDPLPFTFVEQGSREWNYMWAELAKRAENRNLPDPTMADNFGEVWQYMETDEVTAGRVWQFWKKHQYVHCFRHRLHPTKGAYYRIVIPASQGFYPNEIDKTESRQ